MTTDERFPAGAASRRPKLLTLKQVAEQLNVNERHVRRLVFERRIPYVNESWSHCAVISSGLVEESSGGGFDLNA